MDDCMTLEEEIPAGRQKKTRGHKHDPRLSHARARSGKEKRDKGGVKADGQRARLPNAAPGWAVPALTGWRKGNTDEQGRRCFGAKRARR